MEKEKLKKISLELFSENNEHFMDNFRHNLELYISHKDITLSEISEKSGIPFATLNTILYNKNKTKDCKLSTAISIAKALEISIDELVEAGTLDNTVRKNIAIYRNLPNNAVHMIDWYMEHQHTIHQNTPKGKLMLSIMEPTCNGHGNMNPQDIYKHIDVSNLEPDIRSKVFFGLRVPCDHYMPFYSPYDILLVANDRSANPNEHVIVLNDGCLYITKRQVINGEIKFYGLRDNRFKRSEKDVDEVIGYIAHTIKTPIEIIE